MNEDELRMGSRDAVHKMANESGKSLTEIAEAIGFASVSGLTNKFGAKDMRVGFVCEIASLCGYELVLRAKDESKRSIVLMKEG